MTPLPRVTAALRREMRDWRRWTARVVVISFAAAAGLAVVGFTWLTEHALERFFALRASYWWSPLVWTPLCTAAIVWCTRRYAPGAAGSGIPQVMAALDTSVDESRRSLFVSIRLTGAKAVLTACGLLAGLSLGREGPSVQIAAGVMHSARRWLPGRSVVNAHSLLIAGGAAGIAAAFNAPLAGVVFAIEELSRTPEQRNSGLIVTAIVLAGVVAVSAYGNAAYFGRIQVTSVGWTLLGPGLLVALLGGLAGGLFARLLVVSLGGRSPDLFSRWRTGSPVWFAAACGLAVAVVGVVTNGATFGSGYAYTRSMLEGTYSAPALFVLFKFIATWMTTWSGVPAGIFAPSLAIGAALGNDVAMATQYPQAGPLIGLGMAAFLAAVTQAPLTAFIIVMEMVDGHAMVLSLMATALIASGVSRLISRPVYAVLMQFQLDRLRGEAHAAEAKPPAS